jgi:hypothetical protein
VRSVVAAKAAKAEWDRGTHSPKAAASGAASIVAALGVKDSECVGHLAHLFIRLSEAWK